MLKAHNSSAIIAVSDLDRAREFYGETLGLQQSGGGDDQPLTFSTGDTTLVVYPSEFAGTNKANAVVWGVGCELRSIVADLRAKGVTFERYEMEGATFADGVHWFGDFGAAWFKDPDGNLLHLNSGD
ncbi:VOC family protein [Brevundimonas basaltis]|uniref:Catechol 2,3-dioxygenase-like lactoylglutathione lyase family enzyme n=1 Tax=Brevundimonas basaltis TaxID=472166 RepID=A0A7W8HYU6_9CAUL|nr:VOC family protein [Brevundimonas basaltis]MBB5292325.1 catechol 2,3-dioxygenase-like lactoylglutathione lyase family enzyme [Brevundimonas basaltis]